MSSGRRPTQRALTLRPADFWAQYHVAICLLKLERIAEARAHLDACINRRPEFPWSFEPAIRRAAAGTRELAEDQADRSLILHRARRFPEAVAAFDAALAVQPGYARAHRLRAESLMELGHDRDAVAALDRALAGGEPDADSYRLRGLLRRALGRTAGAAEDFTRALEIGPDSAHMRTKRGWSYLLDGWALALQDFDQALKPNPTNSDAHAGRGYALVLLGRDRAGAEAAEQAIHFAPEEPVLVFNAACVYAQAAGKAQADPAAGDLATRYGQRALDLIRRALDLKPPQERAAFWRDGLAPDPALDPIRRTEGSQQLEAALAPRAPSNEDGSGRNARGTDRCDGP